MPTAPTGPATRAHRKMSVAPPTNVDPNSTKPTFPIRVSSYGPRPAAIVSNFPQPAVLRPLPTRETLAQQYARWHRRIPLRDGAQCDRAYVATGDLHTFVRTQQRRRAYAQ